MSRSWLRPVLGLGFIGGLSGSGTYASLITVVIAWFLPQSTLIVLTVLFSVFGLACCAAVVRQFSDKDPQWFVWDEVCGMLASLLTAPKLPLYYLLAFFLFRLFDIWKPGPIRWLENHSGPTGIMNDDLAAGALSAVLLFAATKLF